jgi:hypothetical protein
MASIKRKGHRREVDALELAREFGAVADGVSHTTMLNALSWCMAAVLSHCFEDHELALDAINEQLGEALRRYEAGYHDPHSVVPARPMLH